MAQRKLYHNNGRLVKVAGSVTQYDLGVRVKREGFAFVPSPDGRPKRGKITGFSADSRRRLRLALLSSDLPGGSWRCGVTLTLPWAVDDWQSRGVLDAFRLAVMAFQQSFLRRFPACSMIYRVELQQRGAPHIHAIMYCPKVNRDWAKCLGSFDCFDDSQLRMAIWFNIYALWSRSCDRLLWTDKAVHGGFKRHGVVVEPIQSDYAMMRYLLDHASKSKQAQLGYQGRQWGFVNRRRLVVDPGVEVALSDRAKVYYARAVGNLSRYALNKGNHALAPFGSHKTPRRRVEGVRYGITEHTTRRLVEWAENEASRWIIERWRDL